jgi:hypothetical protein
MRKKKGFSARARTKERCFDDEVKIISLPNEEKINRTVMVKRVEIDN